MCRYHQAHFTDGKAKVSEKRCNVAKLTRFISGRARTGSQVCLTPSTGLKPRDLLLLLILLFNEVTHMLDKHVLSSYYVPSTVVSALQRLNEGIYAKYIERVVSVRFVGSYYYYYDQDASTYTGGVLHGSRGVQWGGGCTNTSNV